MLHDLFPSGIPEWLAPIVLAVELFVIFVIPLLAFHKSRLFPRPVTFQVAAVVAALFYLALPDPIDIGFVDDLFIVALLSLLAVPSVRDGVSDRLTRRGGVTTPRDVTIEPRKEPDAGL